MLVSIAAIILLFVNSSRKKTKEANRKLIAAFEQIVSKEALTIDKKVHFGTRIVGIATEGFLIWVEMKQEKLISENVPLKFIKSCEIVKSYHNQGETTNKKQTQGSLSTIELCVTTDRSSYSITFYNETEDGIFEMLNLKEMAGKWRDYINHSRKLPVAVSTK